MSRITAWSRALAALLVVLVVLQPAASATTLVVGAGLIEGSLQGDFPTGNETIGLTIGSNWSGRWPFTFTTTWLNDNETWPYNVALSQYSAIEQLLRRENHSVQVFPLDPDGPYFVFIDANYTNASIHLEGEKPNIFFDIDRSKVAVSYNPPWPTVMVWCEPDCPNVRSGLSQVLMQVALARAQAESLQRQVRERILALDQASNLSMDPVEASAALEEARGIRALADDYAHIVHGEPHLYTDLWQYPTELRAPFEDHFARMDAREGPSWNATLARLDALEERIGTAREVGAFEKQIGQSDRAIADARAVAITVATIGAIVAILVGLFPMLWEIRQSRLRRQSILGGVATELRKNVDYLQSILNTLDHAVGLFAPAAPQLNNYTPVPLEDNAYLLASTSPDTKLEESPELRLALIQAYDLLRAIREFQRQAANLSNVGRRVARERAYSMLARRAAVIQGLQGLLTEAAELLRDEGILSGLEAHPAPEPARDAPRLIRWRERALVHSPLALLFLTTAALSYFYWRPLLGTILILSALSVALTMLWRRSLLIGLQKWWTLFIATRRKARIAYLLDPKPLQRHESLLLVYVSASAALLIGVTVAQFYEWVGDTTYTFQVRAITTSAIVSPFTTALTLPAWMAMSARLRLVDRETTENETVTAIFPVNLLTPLGFLPYLWAILSVPITHPVTLGHVIEAGFAGSLAVVGAFIPALAVGYAYVIFGATEDGARLRTVTQAAPTDRYGDIGP